MSKDFLMLQKQIWKAIEVSPLKDGEIGRLWADRHGGTAHSATQRVYQWRSSGLPLSIMSLVQLLEILGYEWTITKKKD